MSFCLLKEKSLVFFKIYSLTQLLILKACFPYDRYDRCDRWEKKSSAIAAIIWKPLFSDRSDNDHWDRTFYISAIVVAAIAGTWFPYDRYDRCDGLTFFLGDRSDHMETRL